MIDLQQLNHVNVSDDNSAVEVGPGNRWGRVYSILDEQGIAVLGGRVSTVGVGGLTTGGGISFFSPLYGFVCDTVEVSPTLWWMRLEKEAHVCFLACSRSSDDLRTPPKDQ